MFAAMVTVAAMNRWWITPRLDPGRAHENAVPSLLRNVAIELALGVCVFAVVGLLGGSEPPAHEPGMIPMQHATGGLDDRVG